MDSSILEEHSSYVISSQELWLIFALTFSKLWEKQQNEQWNGCVFLSVVLSWKSWYLKVIVHQKMELSEFVNAQYPWCLFKWAKVTLLLNGKSKICPKHQIVNLSHATPSNHCSAAHTTPGHTKTASPHTPKPQSTSTQPGQSSSHADKLTILVECLHERISRLANVIYSTNNQVQMHLTTIEIQLDDIQRKVEESL